MIIDKKPLTLAEVTNLIGDSEKAQNVKDFIKKFSKMKLEDATKMKEELTALDLVQLKEDHIVSLVNFVPKDSVELNKVLSGVSLNQEEVDKILNVTKNY
jgi:DNA-directed RNA polymerase subunit F